MVEFRCTLTAEAVGRLHGVLSCLAKFHDVLGVDITHGQLSLLALNSSKTSSACVVLSGDVFFQSFHFSVDDRYRNEGDGDQFRCQLYNRSLQSVFKPKGTSATGGGGSKHDDSTIERCEIMLQDHPDKIDCRLVVAMVARSGVRKTHKLTYEPTEVPRALFDKSAALSRWAMNAHMLKSFTEYFGARTELLDIYSENGKVFFTSYTEKVMRGSQVLKQPLQTTIDVDILDFSDFQVEDQVHIGISVKDFRAIVTHAEMLRTTVSAYYSHPKSPMQLLYSEHGMRCEFTLATTGQSRESSTPTTSQSRAPSAAPRAASRAIPSRTVGGQQIMATRPVSTASVSRQATEMPPPSRPVPVRVQKARSTTVLSKPAPTAPSATVDEQSLFVNDDEDESRWNEVNYAAEEDQLGWNDSYTSGPLRSLTQASATRNIQSEGVDAYDESEIPPTQPISEMHGLFD